jgi:hypothetical protein
MIESKSDHAPQSRPGYPKRGPPSSRHPPARPIATGRFSGPEPPASRYPHESLANAVDCAHDATTRSLCDFCRVDDSEKARPRLIKMFIIAWPSINSNRSLRILLLPGTQRLRSCPSKCKVGDHIGLFEACSTFTRATARRLAESPTEPSVSNSRPLVILLGTSAAMRYGEGNRSRICGGRPMRTILVS